MRFEVKNQIFLQGSKPETRQAVMKRCTFPNPEYTQAVRAGRYAGHLQPELRFYQQTRQGLFCPRGAARQIYRICQHHDEQVRIIDQRRTLPTIGFNFKGKLRPCQQAAVAAARKRDHGVLELPTGAGKTTAALYMVAARQQPALVLVHNLELAYQWIERARQFLGVEAGIFGNGRQEIKPLTVATHQTARKHLHELPRHFGYLIADEVHRAPALSCSEVVQAFDCKYLTGLTATGYRRDGLGRLIYLLIGDRVYQVDRGTLESSGVIVRPRVIARGTSFTYSYADDYQAMVQALTTSPERNRMIVNDIRANPSVGTALVCSDRIEHLHVLADMLNEDRQAILTGQTPKAERQRIVDDLNRGEVKVLFSTISLISEGFDCPGLSTLFLASPIKFKGRLIQTIGRILRPAEGKQALIYDYQDVRQPVLAAQARSRSRVYKQQRIPECRNGAA